MAQGWQYLFGPVNSRRLGRSLGVNLFPNKICTEDCLYCECGVTITKTTKRAEYVPTKAVCDELDDFLGQKPQLDFITFAGAGEPLLHIGLGEIVSFIKSNHPQYKICLLTNSTMLVKSDIWREIAAIDLVVPSLDAVTPELFHQINRPNIGCDIAEIITALRNFSWQFTGDLQLEVLFLPGINDTDQEAQAIANACRTIRHSVVQIHTLDRPGTCCDLEPISNERLQELAKHFDKVTLPGRQYQSRPAEELAFDEIKQRIVGLIRLRPSTIPDMLSAIACEKTLLEQAINDLSKSGIIKTKGEFWVYAITAILTD